LENLKGKGHLGHLGICGGDNIKIDLKYRYMDQVKVQDSPVAGPVEYGSELLCSVRDN
jgi:hypothetical protein